MAKRKKASMPQLKKRKARALRYPVSEAHNIDIVNTPANWLRWGELVMHWIDDPTDRPETVRDLRLAMANATPPIQGTVWAGDPDDPDRPVRIEDYPGTGPIIIPLPTPDMIARDLRILRRHWERPVGQRFYPIPGFYAAIYGGVAKVDMTEPQMRALAKRRLGEYVINECM